MSLEGERERELGARGQVSSLILALVQRRGYLGVPKIF